MQSGNVTTPFGQRRVSLALVKGQLDRGGPPPAHSVDKWKVFRDVAEARQRLGLQDRAIAVLDALLTFYPGNELKPDGSLVVFPSNAQLSLRAHGIAGTTLRRHLAALVEAGLIDRRDSPNGKRYARRTHAGDIENAFGFDLRPLVQRAAELANLAQDVVREAQAFRRAKEALTICRRDIRKLITAAMEEGADGDWSRIEEVYITILARLPRAPGKEIVESVLDELQLLRGEIVNRLELLLKTQNTEINDVQNGRHIQISNPESITELEPRFRKDESPATRPRPADPTVLQKAFPLAMVLKACPQIIDYGPGGAVANWRDLMSAAVVVRSMLGISPSAYEDACDAMGPENSAIMLACILERSAHIQSAGGYLRDLTSKTRRGEFSLGPVLMALLRSQGEKPGAHSLDASAG
ncbi:plasmid replication protein RepC [Rhizobium sp. FKY42]|uniref:plasmid replication protein RepC n=1 Tax=Rhizobium sp. FKY42 TaxID=2562310 RepID=UPI0010C0D0AD|nr:plasmid replication protein RepC [Rhizobium sp. FKY42]